MALQIFQVITTRFLYGKTILIICLIFFSCSNRFYKKEKPYNLINSFNQCYNSDSIKHEFLTNGYFSQKNFLKTTNNNDTTNIKEYTIYFMFFKDGIFLYNFHSNCGYDKSNYCIKNYLNDIRYDSLSLLLFHNSFYWGLYKLYDDTIKTIFINHPSMMNEYILQEKLFIVNSHKKTIQEIISRPVGFDKNSMNYYNEAQSRRIINEAVFIKVDSLPSSNCWLKREKWFWCNEEDWRNYMDSVNLNSTK